jgi:hypothetical protein
VSDDKSSAFTELNRRLANEKAQVSSVKDAGIRVVELISKNEVFEHGLVANIGKRNDQAVKSGGRILCTFDTGQGHSLLDITEADRSITTALLPLEF